MPAEKLEYQQLLYNAYDRILNNSKPKLDDSGYVECLVVSHSGETVRNRHANTFKVSFGKGKRLAHRVIYEAHHGPPSVDMDVSHLCHNESCCKVEHLHQESHADNMKRIGCMGWLKFGDNPRKVVSACVHTPHCVKVTPHTRRTINPTQVDQ